MNIKRLDKYFDYLVFNRECNYSYMVGNVLRRSLRFIIYSWGNICDVVVSTKIEFRTAERVDGKLASVEPCFLAFLIIEIVLVVIKIQFITWVSWRKTIQISGFQMSRNAIFHWRLALAPTYDTQLSYVIMFRTLLLSPGYKKLPKPSDSPKEVSMWKF